MFSISTNSTDDIYSQNTYVKVVMFFTSEKGLVDWELLPSIALSPAAAQEEKLFVAWL